ncbi:hypothetical protein DFJ63DRAFT_311778 [Scheffersomyces coipomensis]|uniref:uncharacterized protein n=1 Tax=Scheffersomyces coipomensis TaxID=1788519 RepID=UPI00315C6167
MNSYQSGSVILAGNINFPDYSCGATVGVFPDVTYDAMVDVYLCGILEGRYWAENYYTGKTSKQKSTATQTSGQSSTTTQISQFESDSDGLLTSTAESPVITLAPGQIEGFKFGDLYVGSSVDNSSIGTAYLAGITQGQYEVLGYIPNFVTNNATSNHSNISKFGWLLVIATILYSIISIPI